MFWFVYSMNRQKQTNSVIANIIKMTIIAVQSSISSLIFQMFNYFWQNEDDDLIDWLWCLVWFRSLDAVLYIVLYHLHHLPSLLLSLRLFVMISSENKLRMNYPLILTVIEFFLALRKKMKKREWKETKYGKMKEKKRQKTILNRLTFFDDHSFTIILVTKMKTNLLHSDRQTKQSTLTIFTMKK